MRISSPLAALFACLCLVVGGCATVPPKGPTTTVILMPDEDGHVGAVTVTTDAGTEQITEAYASSTVTGTHGRPTAMSAPDHDGVTAGYEALLKAQPPKPISFTLYFLLDRTTLTDESRAMIPAVLAAVRERKPTEISIFGHTDSMGTEKHNVKLSEQRAHVVADLLKKDDPTLDHIEQQFFGDRLPLVQSGTRAEPRNRRAEIQIL